MASFLSAHPSIDATEMSFMCCTLQNRLVGACDSEAFVSWDSFSSTASCVIPVPNTPIHADWLYATQHCVRCGRKIWQHLAVSGIRRGARGNALSLECPTELTNRCTQVQGKNESLCLGVRSVLVIRFESPAQTSSEGLENLGQSVMSHPLLTMDSRTKVHCAAEEHPPLLLQCIVCGRDPATVVVSPLTIVQIGSDCSFYANLGVKVRILVRYLRAG